MIWIIGEYAERIDNADELLESFVEGFHDENTQVQLQLLTSVVKLFLKRPADTQELVQRVLSLATQVRKEINAKSDGENSIFRFRIAIIRICAIAATSIGDCCRRTRRRRRKSCWRRSR